MSDESFRTIIDSTGSACTPQKRCRQDPDSINQTCAAVGPLSPSHKIAPSTSQTPVATHTTRTNADAAGGARIFENESMPAHSAMAISAEVILKRLDRRTDDVNMIVLEEDDDRFNRVDLNAYSILTCLSIPEKQAIVEHAKTKIKLDRCMGSMVGMAVGDALGHPFEFLPARDVPGSSYFDLNTMEFMDINNVFLLKRGQWTDDAAMGLCMADSIIMHQRFSGADMRVRFWCWWNRAYNNAFRKDPSRGTSVGLGGNISKSLDALDQYAGPRRAEISDRYEASTQDSGNGSLMRFTPVSIWLHSASCEEVYEYARRSSYTTHPGLIAAEACSLLGHLIVAALNLPPGLVDPKAFLERETVEYMRSSGLMEKSGPGYDEMKWLVLGKPEKETERCWAWREESLDIAGTLKARGRSYNGYPVSADYFGSYAMDGLAMALWSIYHTKSFDEAVARSVNLLGDADSHGSITGQLAGALYGYTSINPQFIEWLTRWDDYEFAVRAVLLHHLGEGRSSEES